MKNLFNHTPEGVRDVYNGEYMKKMYVKNNLFNTLYNFGYMPIDTPTFEYFDTFSKEVGTTASNELYKFFDREGNTLVLRPDITPSIARAAAMYFNEDDTPTRLCYSGNVFVNHHSHQGRMDESTQIGGELIGDSSEEADSEIIAICVNGLKSVGVNDFLISVGHVDICQGLIEAAKLDDEATEQLLNLIENKNFYGMVEFLESLKLPENLVDLFSVLGQMYTTPADFKEVKERSRAYTKVYNAFCYLEKLYELLEAYGVTDYISIEPGLHTNFKYYTGIVFSGYTYGYGEPILKGGRYDKLLSYFGPELPAIGLAFYVDSLFAAIERQKVDIAYEKEINVIVYKKDQYKDAVSKSIELRQSGKRVMLVPENDKLTDDNYKNAYSNASIVRL